jgi:hypothetical protein
VLGAGAVGEAVALREDASLGYGPVEYDRARAEPREDMGDRLGNPAGADQGGAEPAKVRHVQELEEGALEALGVGIVAGPAILLAHERVAGADIVHFGRLAREARADGFLYWDRHRRALSARGLERREEGRDVDPAGRGTKTALMRAALKAAL